MALTITTAATASSTTTGIEKVPVELMQEIISRLPIQSLSQSRYVCKPWNTLISDPRVSTIHYSRSVTNPNPSSLIFVSYFESNAYSLYYTPDIETCDKAIKLTKLPQTPNLVPYDNIVGSVHGFICFADIELGNVNLVICNPVSGDSVKLPVPKPKWNESPYLLGFGCNRKSNEYKVIVVYKTACNTYTGQLVEKGKMSVKVLTLGEENNWRSIAPITRCRVGGKTGYNSQNPGAFLNGYLHWLTYDDEYYVRIMVFNVEDESFCMIPVPDSISGPICFKINLGVLGGCLMIADTSQGSLHVWIMKVYGLEKSWVLEFVIPSNNGVKICESSRPLGYQNNGNVVVRCTGELAEYGADILSSYDPKTRTHRKLALDEMEGFYEVIPHMGTLATLKDVIAMPLTNVAGRLSPSREEDDSNAESEGYSSGAISFESDSGSGLANESGDVSTSGEDVSDFDEGFRNSDDD